MLRIAWIIQGDEQWGIRSGSRALITALEARGVACPIIALGDGEFTEECVALGFDVTKLGMGPVPSFSGHLVNKLFQFAKLTRKEMQLRKRVTEVLGGLRADAVHFRRPNLVAIAGQAGHAHGLPVFWHIPNAIGSTYPFGLNRRLYQRRCHRYGIVPLANSRYTASTLGYSPVRPHVLYLAVDRDRFDPAAIDPVPRASLGIADDAVVVGIIARVHPSKGQDRAIHAVENLVRQGHDIHLLVIGGPVSSDYYRQVAGMVEQSDSKDHIHLIGAVSDTERYYGVMDISLNSRVDPEPCGISVLESMMSETPVLAHANGGPAETVIDGVTGWHYTGGTADDIEAGLLRALDERSRWPEIGSNARRHAIEHFSMEAQAEQYLGIVREVLNSRDGGRTRGP